MQTIVAYRELVSLTVDCGAEQELKRSGSADQAVLPTRPSPLALRSSHAYHVLQSVARRLRSAKSGLGRTQVFRREGLARAPCRFAPTAAER